MAALRPSMFDVAVEPSRHIYTEFQCHSSTALGDPLLFDCVKSRARLRLFTAAAAVWSLSMTTAGASSAGGGKRCDGCAQGARCGCTVGDGRHDWTAVYEEEDVCDFGKPQRALNEC